MDQAVAGAETSVPEAQTYRLSPAARRTLVALLLGVLAIAVYAIWTLVSLLTSGLDGPEWITAALMLLIFVLSPAVAWSLLAEHQATITTDAAGLTFRTFGGVDLPYGWAQVGGITPLPSGLGRLSLGDKARSAGRTAEFGPGRVGPSNEAEQTIAVPVSGAQEETRPPADAAVAPDPAAEAGPDEGTIQLLAVDPPAYTRLANPLTRLLYRQAYAGGLPLYPGLADRPALLAEIARRAGR